MELSRSEDSSGQVVIMVELKLPKDIILPSSVPCLFYKNQMFFLDNKNQMFNALII
jgi:hypothetical protein